jgi:hypothetical protein
MVSISVPGMYGWGNPSAQLLGVLRSSPSHRSGLGAPFFVGETASLRLPSSVGAGSCDCPAAAHGKPCKHLQSWRLYQYIARKGEAVTPAPVATAPPALPVAPASVNVHIIVAGRDVLLTLRDTDEVRLLCRLEEVLQHFPLPQASSPPQERGRDWCPIHNVQMRQTAKEGRSWYSHKTDQGWCEGRGRR